jgi:ubiquinone/menaquinone biosynthesis C-methylase UbiE
MNQVSGESAVIRRRDVIREAKYELRQGHNRWLKTQDTVNFYNNPIHAWRVERILSYTKNIQGRVLDVGCFVGAVAERIVQQGGKKVIGMDCLKAALEIATSRGIQTVFGDLDEAVIDFPDNYFDCIVAADVLNSVFDPDAVVEEICRVLKFGGKLIITVPNLACIGNRLLMLLGRSPYNLEVRARRGVGHLRLFTFDTLRALLIDQELKILNMESSVFVSPLIRLNLNRLPLMWRLLKNRQEYEWGRWAYSKKLAKWFPRLGENIIVYAENVSK